MKRAIALLGVILLLLSIICIPTVPYAGKPKIPKGAYGVWQVSALSTSTPLYEAKSNSGKDRQKVVDKENAAVWMPYGKGHAIVDHLDSVVGGGVWRVNGIVVDDIATLTTKNGTKYYHCVAVWLATQTKYVYQWEDETISCKKGDIICVSCADADGYDYVAYFKPL